MKRILTGSRAFFSGMEGFHPHDSDYIEIVEPKDVDFYYKNCKKEGTDCIFQNVRRPKDKRIRWALKYENPMSLCNFLIPEFAREFNITIEDLETLRPMRDMLDRRHQYLGVIYDAYIANGDFTLTDEQRQTAFDEYTKERTRQ
ncbi:MAG: hypothetical protein J1E37_06060 [Prevotella sp.]|nr:hypothetical protein [Prevotella sp.]